MLMLMTKPLAKPKIKTLHQNFSEVVNDAEVDGEAHCQNIDEGLVDDAKV